MHAGGDVVVAVEEKTVTEEQLAEITRRLIEEGQRCCSGHVLVLDAFHIRRVLQEVMLTVEAEQELKLIREAARDTSLSDAAVRAIANGTEPPTPDDIEWARSVLGGIDVVAS